MRPMTAELGISAATFGFAIALQNIVWGLSQPFVGALADRHGARPVLIGTALHLRRGPAADGLRRRLPGGPAHRRLPARHRHRRHRLRRADRHGVARHAAGEAQPDRRPGRRRRLARHHGDRAARPWLIDGFGWQTAHGWCSPRIAGSMALLVAADPRTQRSAQVAVAVERPRCAKRCARPSAHRGYLFMTLAFFACGFQLVFITTHLPAYLRSAAWRRAWAPPRSA